MPHKSYKYKYNPAKLYLFSSSIFSPKCLYRRYSWRTGTLMDHGPETVNPNQIRYAHSHVRLINNKVFSSRRWRHRHRLTNQLASRRFMLQIQIQIQWEICKAPLYEPSRSAVQQQQAVRLGGRRNMPPPRDFDFWPFDLEVGVGVACAKMLRIDAFVDDDDSFCFMSLLISVMMSDSSHCQSRN